MMKQNMTYRSGDYLQKTYPPDIDKYIADYDAAGRLPGFANFNGTQTTYGYDNANRLTAINNRKADSTTISNYTFTLDGNGNRTNIDQTEPYAPAIGEGATVDYTYNTQKNRLTAVAGAPYTYDNEGQLLTSNGGVNSYTFDYEHRLKTIAGGSTATFYYDGSGNRLKAVRSSTETRYIYDAAGRLLAEADSNNNITKYYIYGNGLLAMVTPANDVYCYHFNGVGSTIAMTDNTQAVVNQYSYDAFGNIADQQEAVSQPFKYVGQFGVMTEPNGFYYMKARYYDPAIGRFISEDPIGFDGGDVNLMAYVGNNPVTGIDPSGLYWFRQDWQTDFVVGREESKLVRPGGAISRFIEDYVPAGRTFGDLHDGFVGFTAPEGSAAWRDWLTNIPSMIPMYAIAIGTEVLRTVGIIDQPKPTPPVAPCAPMQNYNTRLYNAPDAGK